MPMLAATDGTAPALGRYSQHYRSPDLPQSNLDHILTRRPVCGTLRGIPSTQILTRAALPGYHLATIIPALRRHRLAVRTGGSQLSNRGSIPRGATRGARLQPRPLSLAVPPTQCKHLQEQEPGAGCSRLSSLLLNFNWSRIGGDQPPEARWPPPARDACTASSR